MDTEEVNNREAAKSQAHRPGSKETFVIGSTMNDRAGHLLEERERHACFAIGHQFSADSAHDLSFYLEVVVALSLSKPAAQRRIALHFAHAFRAESLFVARLPNSCNRPITSNRTSAAAPI